MIGQYRYLRNHALDQLPAGLAALKRAAAHVVDQRGIHIDPAEERRAEEAYARQPSLPFPVIPGKRPPAPPAPTYPLEVLERAHGRAAICGGCDDCRRVTAEAGGAWLNYYVSCRGCGCAAMSLIDGMGCPAGKW